MGTLGLNGPPPREENLFKRIFWPANQPYKADSLGQQGLWVCIVVGLVSAGFAFFQGNPLLGLLVLAFYWTGGMGVREHSVAAAIIVAAGYSSSAMIVVLLGGSPGILDLIIMGLLLVNIRGTWIASSWKRRGDPGTFPERLNSNFTDKLIDQWPVRFWPRGQFLFYAVAFVYAGLFALGVVGTLRLRAAQRPQPQELQLQVTPPSR
jgi:hypothetical protein